MPSSKQKRNIILTGFMGTGKTTVGKLLAEQLDCEFIDTDLLIEARHGAIAQIFAEQGETVFRQIERDIARELAHREGIVISTGGRMMLDPANVASLGQNGRVFCLVATPTEILARVTNDSSRIERPLLNVPNPSERIMALLQERHEKYQQFPQIITSGQQPVEVVETILTYLEMNP